MNESTLKKFIAIVGENNAITTPADMASYLKEPRDKWHGTSALVLRPATTQQVSDIAKLANDNNLKLVPQSGNTGLVGGQVPMANDILISLDRMTEILDVDAADYTITVEAGAILKSVQHAAEAVDRLFPLSLASEGSCRIGGNLSSNAGGLNVLAYGNARDLCLGLEVVLADGRIWNGLRKLRKDNTGYDLKNLFIGAEGTLGIITKAVLKLYPKPRRYDTGFIAVPHVEAALALLALAKAESGNRVIAFELMSDFGLQLTSKHMGHENPLPESSPWYVLTELADAASGTLEHMLEQALEARVITNAVIAQSEAQRQKMWALREALSESQRHEGGSIKHDVSVPVSHIPAFIAEATAALLIFMPGARLVCFGHLGDGNLHFNVSQPVDMDKKKYLEQWHTLNWVIFNVVLKHQGSISAEHGIGQLKRDDMLNIKSPVELDLMRSIKSVLDPRTTLNPGKVLP
jgi:FAD/FMN-containing dehydrogenase